MRNMDPNLLLTRQPFVKNINGSSNITVIIILVIAVFAAIFVFQNVKKNGDNSELDSVSDSDLQFAGSSITATSPDPPQTDHLNNMKAFGDRFRSQVSASTALLVMGVLILFIIAFNSFSAYRKAKKDLARLRKKENFQKDEGGQAMTEFIIIFPIILLMTTLIMQTSLVKCARMVVSYAAFCGARSAIVWIPCDDKDCLCREDKENCTGEYDIDPDFTDEVAKEQWHHIKTAVQLALVPAGSPIHDLFGVFDTSTGQYEDLFKPIPDAGGAVSKFLGDLDTTFEKFMDTIGDLYIDLVPSIARRLAYVAAFTQISVTDLDGRALAPEPFSFDKIQHREPVSVQVRFLYHLRVPLANAIIGGHLDDEMAETMGFTDYLPTEISPVVFNDFDNYYAILEDKSTLLVERKFNHDLYPW